MQKLIAGANAKFTAGANPKSTAGANATNIAEFLRATFPDPSDNLSNMDNGAAT